MKNRITVLIVVAIILLSAGCNGGRSEYIRLVELEQVLEQNPDSVRSVLYAMPTPNKERSKALYTVLKTQADYKCYEPLESDSLMLEATAYYGTGKKDYYAALAYYTLGCVYDEKGNDIVALEAYLKAKDLFPDTLIRYYVLNLQNIGTIYLNTIVLDEADSYLNRAFKIAQQMDDKVLLDNIYYNLGKLELYKGDYQLSDSLFSKLLDSEVYAADAYFQRSKISYYYKEDYLNAMGLIERHLEIDTTSYGLLTKANIYMCKQQYDSAHYFYNLAIAMGGLNLAAYCDLYNQLSIIEKYLGNIDSHYNYRDMYLELKDSLYENREDKRIMNLTNNYKLTVVQINAKNRAIVANIVIALLIVGSVSVLLITWLILNRRNKIILLNHKREINSIVADIKRQQLIQNETGVTVDRDVVVQRYNELLLKCIDEFKRMSIYNELINSSNSINASLVSGIYDTVFKTFSPVIIYLHEEYPCLTENETLTCILSALNISVKQIADIQGRSQDAVYKQKYRLKEKLPLDVYELFFPKGNL